MGIAGRGVEGVEGVHEVFVDFGLFGFQVLLVTLQHIVGGVAHPLHLVLLRDVES